MTKVLYTGSFDPITRGHMDIINQASQLFDEVVVAILINPNKKDGFFTMEERLNIMKKIYEDYDNVKIICEEKAAVDVAEIMECSAIIRGLRGLSDFDYEIGLANINKQISNNKVNTICLFADNKYQFISTSMVKEVFRLGKDISLYVDDIVKEEMKEKVKVKEYGNKNIR